MDRCRCEDNAAAVRNLQIYTPGTYLPLIIDKFNAEIKKDYVVIYFKKRIDLDDLNFVCPKARGVNSFTVPDAELSNHARKIKKMWCPYMLPVPDPVPAKATDK